MASRLAAIGDHLLPPSISCTLAAGSAAEAGVDVLEAEASYELLGVSSLINAQGHITTLGGSRMPEPVVAAMVRASQSYVQVNELHQKAGAHIARLVGAPAAFVSDGAASGMFLCGCAVLAGADTAKIRALPTVASGRNEFIISQVEGWHVRVGHFHDQTISLSLAASSHVTSPAVYTYACLAIWTSDSSVVRGMPFTDPAACAYLLVCMYVWCVAGDDRSGLSAGGRDAGEGGDDRGQSNGGGAQNYHVMIML